MFLNEPPKSTARKELKVHLPLRTHRHLRDLQRQTGEQTPSIVAAALDLYFARLRAEQPAA